MPTGWVWKNRHSLPTAPPHRPGQAGLRPQAGTVEERIHQLQQQKSQLADALLADADISTRLTPDALGALLAPME